MAFLFGELKNNDEKVVLFVHHQTLEQSLVRREKSRCLTCKHRCKIIVPFNTISFSLILLLSKFVFAPLE